ncbi:MAG: ATP-binding protein [Clostridium sp.]|nr:ATP-binding protein [Clostridium sp.]MDU7083699.1 ATP-binding protein [Clostridium sp.]
MFKTLKSKLTLIYLILIVSMALIGILSARNLFVISKDISGLLKSNYKSIQAVNNMKDAIFNQQYALSLYLTGSTEEGVDMYTKNNSLFFENLHQQKNNITETGEEEYVDKLCKYYEEYNSNFFTLSTILNEKNSDDAYNYFYDVIKVNQGKILNTLNGILSLNEKNMLLSTDRVATRAENMIFVTIFFTFTAILIAFRWSRNTLKKLLLPLNNIINAIKAVKANGSYHELEVTSEDELGELTTQFNLMSKRIQSFEQSTLGELFKERNNSNAILKSIDSPMVVIDNDYKVTMANNDFIKSFVIHEEKIEGKYLTHIVKDKNFFSIIYEIATHGIDRNMSNVIEMQTENNELHYYNISINEILEDNVPIGKVILLKDVTYLKKTEQISKDFFTTISHEFKTPLTSIMIGTGLLESNKIGELSEDQRKIIETIKEDGERLNILVSNMLLLSKIESSTDLYKQDYCFVEDLIKTAVSTNKEVANYNGIILEYNVDKNIQPLFCDGEKIIWVLNNLITNAIRHCKDGDLISIRSFNKNSSLNITVTDTGAGILKEYTSLIFDKFMQINKDVKNSSGLGLWICKDIIEAHNGTIECESDLGEGATFTITIPNC